MEQLLGIGWWMWLFASIWLIGRITKANWLYIVFMRKRYVMHYPFYLGSLALFAVCILNHPYQ